MTQRDPQKRGRTAAARASSRTARTDADTAAKSPGDALEQLERERDQLRVQLAAAEARIKLLENERLDVLNRIDWVIDSIHNVLERET